MKSLKNGLLVKITLILIIILLSIIIIKECKILGFCYTIINLISPIFFGFVFAWLIKPIMLYLNRHLNVIIASSITYVLIIFLVSLISYFALPIMIREIRELVALLMELYENIDPNLIKNMDLSTIGTKVFAWFNHAFTDIKNLVLNIFYAIFIGFFFLINHEKVSNFFAKRIPPKLIEEVSMNLKAYVRGTLIDTLVLFILTIIIFHFIKLPYALLFAILISLTNIIPYIGPYIGGIPSVLVAFGISSSLGFAVFGIVIVLQFIESMLIHPYIMSKALEINQILIMMSLIICGYFWGVIGMLISTPIISVIKTLYEYNKAHHLITWPILYK